MTLDELISALQAQRINEHYGALQVVMNTQSGSGEISAVVLEYDTVLQRFEIGLQEKP